MSHSFGVYCHTCGNNLSSKDNYTSNVSGFWFEMLGIKLYEMDGMSALTALPKLQSAVDRWKRMDSWEIDELKKKHEPDNGWGNLKGAMEVLESLRDACARDPLANLYVSH